jgi:DNA polymerase-3 subunit gamma/tau
MPDERAATSDPDSTAKSPAYQVLARKYRPRTFADMIGHQAMVRTLSNAIAGGRLAHAFMLTGVRGIGKTTTARIIARALNCAQGPTIEPCGTCEHCRAILEDRHLDVIEMDAASRTGVDEIRELIDGVRYRPTSARYKIYIVDEVHMLSRNAFNALLKTLEEPPEHVKFIFATTEIRKVPVTVLSRCQRFDLRRIDVVELTAYFRSIAEREGTTLEETALHMIARAADGSVRDGLSLLDQAISHGGGTVTADQVQGMLGLADRVRTFDLMEATLAGRTPEALAILDDLYDAGADPAVVIEDLLELTHWLTRIKLVPAAATAPGVPEAERTRGAAMAEKLTLAHLARSWQMLLKGLSEVRMAPAPLQAAEMVLVRLAYAADLPTPAEAVEALRREGGAPTAPPSAAQRPPDPRPPRAALPSGGVAASAPRAEATESPPVEDKPDPRSFADVVELAGRARAMILQANLVSNVHLVRFEPGRIEFRPEPLAPPDLAQQLVRFLNGATRRTWSVVVSREGGDQTLSEQARAADAAARAEAGRHPLVQAVLAAFPGAEVESVRSLVAEEPPSATDEEAPDDAPGEEAEE